MVTALEGRCGKLPNPLQSTVTAPNAATPPLQSLACMLHHETEHHDIVALRLKKPFQTRKIQKRLCKFIVKSKQLVTFFTLFLNAARMARIQYTPDQIEPPIPPKSPPEFHVSARASNHHPASGPLPLSPQKISPKLSKSNQTKVCLFSSPFNLPQIPICSFFRVLLFLHFFSPSIDLLPVADLHHEDSRNARAGCSPTPSSPPSVNPEAGWARRYSPKTV